MDSISRRSFLLKTACGAAVVSLDAAIPPVFARAAARLAPGGGDGEKARRLLVVIGLYGGNDGLNTVVPYEDDAYHRARPTIGVKKEKVVRLSDTIGLHPSLAPWKALFDEGRLAIVQGVGYPDPSYSHFESMDKWMAGDVRGAAAGSGWLARAEETRSPESRSRFSSAALGGGLPLALSSPRLVVPSIASFEQYQIQTDNDTPEDSLLERDLIRAMSRLEPGDEPPFQALARRVLRESIEGVDVLREALRNARATSNAYPATEIGRELAMAARLVAADLSTRVIHVSYGGFDTHANQDGQHARLLSQLAEALTVFLGDLKALGRDRDTLVLTMSEFGRRLAENGSAGTDHGTAAPLFAIGPGVVPGIHGAHPSLSDLHLGRDLKFTADYRSVYAAALDRWLGVPSETVLGARFEPAPFLPG